VYSQGGATVGSSTSLSEASTLLFETAGGQKWPVVTALVRRNTFFYRKTPLITRYATSDSKYKDFPKGV